jgi:hypothetical protein
MNTRSMLVWLALVGFMLGTSVCPFGDLNGGEVDRQWMKESTAMPIFTKPVTSTTDLPATESTAPAGVETATFALG